MLAGSQAYGAVLK
uniref:Uncharacterized protein n=1 Tax=Arundo donax TaxID=35708 RepID=A0A0A8Y6U0_ARUDO